MWFLAGWTISRMRLPFFTPRFCISGRYYFFATSSFLRFFFFCWNLMATALGTASACFFAAKFFSFCFFCSEGRNSFPLLPLCCPTEIAILREILKGKNKISVWGNTWVKKNKNEISMAGWGGKTKLQFEGNSTPFQKVKIWKWKSNLFPGTKKIEVKMQRAANKPYPNFVFSGNHPPPSDKKSTIFDAGSTRRS